MKRIRWKILWIIGTIIACALWFLLVGFIGFGINVAINMTTQPAEPSLNTNLWATAIYTGWAVLVVLSIVLWRRWNFRCQACKRWGALTLEKTELAKQEKISVLMEMEHRDWQGNVTGYHDQYIPGKRKTYLYTYKCKHCGNLENRTQTRDNPST